MPRPQSTRVKQLGEDRIGGYGVVFGNPDQRDLYGDYFTAETDFWLGEYRDQPVMYDHALGQLPLEMDAKIPRNFKLGRVVKAVVDTIGLWIEAVIEEHNDWAEAVLSLVDQGIMHWSSGSVSHLVTYGPDYQIVSWPVVEMSITPTPAEPRQTDIVRLKHFVSNQDTPEATALKAARRGAPETLSTDHPGMEDLPPMLTLNDSTFRAMVWAYAENNLDALKAAMDTIKQADGDVSNAIAEMVAPLAEQLAEMAGADVSKAQAYLIEFITQNAMGEAEPEPEPEPAPAMTAPPSALSASAQQQVQAEVAKQLQALLKQQPDGAFLTPKQKNVQPLVNRERDKPLTLTRFVKSIVNYRHDVLDYHKPKIHAAYRAMGINPDTAGGYLVPPEYANEIIELLRSGSRVLPLCLEWPMVSDKTYVPKQTGGATVYWVGENAVITDSALTVGQVELDAKKAAALVYLSNELLEDGGAQVDALIRNDISMALAEALDHVILEGEGVANEPTGLSVHPDVTKTALNAAPTVDNILACINRVEVENVRLDPAWHWVMNPRDRKVLASVRDTTSGDYLWTELGLPGHTLVGGYPTELRGYPYVTTTQITVDTDNNNETKIYFGQWKDVIVGMRKTIELMATNVGGNTFAYDQTGIRAIMRADVNIRHPESIEVLTDVRTS